MDHNVPRGELCSSVRYPEPEKLPIGMGSREPRGGKTAAVRGHVAANRYPALILARPDRYVTQGSETS